MTSGVQAEQQQEQAAIKKLYAAGSLRQLQKDGVVLLQLQAAPSHVLYSSMVWRFSPGGGGRPRDLPYHRFRQGDSLLISRFSEEEVGGGIGLEGRVGVEGRGWGGREDVCEDGVRVLTLSGW